MPTLYSFGDSFSEDFEIFTKENFKNTWRYDYIHNFLNGSIPMTFANIIANNLGYDYKCKAAIYGNANEGNCNQSMYNNFCLESPNLLENDIVFFGYTNPVRFKWFNPNTGYLGSVLPNNLIHNVSEEEISAMEQILLNREKKVWCDEYVKFEKLIVEFSKCKNFKVFFWSHDDMIYKNLQNHIKNNQNWLMGNQIIKSDYSLIKILKNNHGYSIQDETNGHNKDSHYGKTAHEVLAKLFLKEIIENNLI